MIRVIGHWEPNIVVEYHPAPTDPEEVAKMRTRQERAKRNEACWQANAKEIYTQHRGKHICFAGGEFFVADSAPEAKAKGTAAHPEDDSSFVLYVPKERMLRIYANRRRLAPL
jgi:hypothetical protein